MSLPHSAYAKTIGNTPLVPLLCLHSEAELLVKVESRNPLGSVKDRIALGMIEAAEQADLIGPGAMLIEPTSGNTGIGLAFVCAGRGYRLILTMPEHMSLERQKLLRHLGAELELTPKSEGMAGAMRRATELQEQHPGSWMPNQFTNRANAATHERSTGPELWQQSGGRLDALVSGVGTGGTLTGAGRYLRTCNPRIHLVAVEPAGSPVLSGGEPGPHAIQGIGAGFVPPVLDLTLVDEVLTVTDEEAITWARTLAAVEGILCGISGGAALAAALHLAKRPSFRGKRIALILPDSGERYLSTELVR